MKKRGMGFYKILGSVLIFMLLWTGLPATVWGTQKDAESAAAAAAEQVIAGLHAESAVLIDADTGRVLLGKGEEIPRPMASTTKIMTCILALEYGQPDDVITASAYASGQPKVHLGTPAGRTFYLKDLLYSLMLESHNDSAVMIAEHIGGSVEGFADLMNQKAKELGCENTCFITPNGLDAQVTDADGTVQIHSTTARELAAIMRYCVWQSPVRDEFLEITRTQNYYFTDLEKKGSYSCTNHNAFLTMEPSVLSGKTGFTSGAGYSYVAALEDGGRRYVLVLLGCGWPPHKTYKWSDARLLCRYGKEYYQLQELLVEPVLPEIPVLEGINLDGSWEKPAVTSLCVRTNDQPLRFLMHREEQVEIQVFISEQLEAPVKEGEIVGRVEYRLGETVIRSFPVYTTQAVDRISPIWCVKEMLNLFMLN